MSNRCKVESCSKWVFEGGLCRGHMPVPQASGHVAVTAATSLFPKQPALPPHPPVLTLPGVERISGAKGGLTAPGTLQSIVARMMQHLRECSLRNDHRPTGSPFCVFVGARDDALPPANKNTYIWSCSWSCTCAGGWECSNCKSSWPYTRSQCHAAQALNREMDARVLLDLTAASAAAAPDDDLRQLHAD